MRPVTPPSDREGSDLDAATLSPAEDLHHAKPVNAPSGIPMAACAEIVHRRLWVGLRHSRITLENDTIAGLTKEAICRKKKATAASYGRGYKIWYNG